LAGQSQQLRAKWGCRALCAVLLSALGFGAATAFAQASAAPNDSGWGEMRPDSLGSGDPASGTDVVTGMAALSGTGSAAPASGAGTGPDLAAIAQAWNAKGDPIDQRIGRTRRAAIERGVWNLDSAARALIQNGKGSIGIEEARAAIRLAPDLPLAHMALGRALWLQESSPFAAIRAIWRAMLAIPRHLESTLWFAGTGLYVLAWGMISGGLLCIALAAGAASTHAAHDLGDLVSDEMPAFARAAFLAAVVGIPLALGQGWVGLGLAMFAVATLYATARQRCALAFAAAVVVAGLYPVARLSGAALTAYSADPALEAAYSSTDGFATAIDRSRLEHRQDDDALAVQALAVDARRSGNLATADSRYQRIVADGTGDLAMLNNAANVRLALGHMELALDLYRSASERGDSPKVLFNLAQAYGAAFAVEDLNRTLAEAQRLNGDTVAELTQLQGSEQKGFTVDLPLERRPLWRRALASTAPERFAAELRDAAAPGVMGNSWQVAAISFAAVLTLSVLGGRRLRASRRCSRCGRRLCPRCDPEFGGGEICEGCTRLFHHPETTDRSLRLARVNALRRRDARVSRVVLFVSMLLPGTAGLFARQPWSSLLASLATGVAAWAIVFSDGVASDPLVAGSAAQVAFLGIAFGCLAVHAVTVAMSVAERRRS
jgi:tetratricopeptide (TPR) repeat protein